MYKCFTQCGSSLMERSYWLIPNGVLMAIVRAGCHQVAITQVVEH